ncbi:MAG: RidA family protein [Pricia sp.]
MKMLFATLTLVALVSCNAEEKTMTDAPEKAQVERPEADYDPEANLKALNIELRTLSTPVANYVHAVRTGNLIFLAGKGPKKADGNNITGKVGTDLTIEEGYAAAREAGINQLSVLKSELGNLNKVKRIVKVKGMVNAPTDFTDQPKVVNGFSDLMVEVFGERGKHARAAVGMGSLPGNMAVEVEMVVEVFGQ